MKLSLTDIAGIAVIERVAEDLIRYNMLPAGIREGAPLGVAVSGGADSVCLLEVLAELRGRFGYRLAVLHLNHGLRGEASEEDARFVARLAARHGAEYYERIAEVGREAAERDENLEQRARRARIEFFTECMGGGLVARVATAHTRSDQAETVLMRMARGAGGTGLAGILPVTKEGLIRPMLRVGRAEVEGWLRERGMEWREDESNRDLRFQRNRVRHRVMPLLAREMNPKVEEALAAMAEVVRAEEEYWEETVGAPAAVGGVVIVEAGWIGGAPRAVGRRRARAAMAAVKGDLRQIEFGHVERMVEMARGAEGHDRAQFPGLDVFRSFDRIRVAPSGFDNGVVREFEAEAEVGRAVGLPGGGEIGLRRRATGRGAGCDTLKLQLDWEKVLVLLRETGGGLRWRHWRPGDRYQPGGRRNVVKVKEMFQQERVPLWERRYWPVLVCGDEIVWARRFGPAGQYAAAPGCAAVVEVSDGESQADESRTEFPTSDS